MPTKPLSIAKKLVDTDISKFISGKTGKESTKKLTKKMPTLVTDYVGDDEESNDARFGGGNISKDKSARRADYQPGEDEAAYESRKLPDAILERLIRKFNAQKEGALTGHKPSSHETDETEGLETTEPRKKIAVRGVEVSTVTEAEDPNEDAPNPDNDVDKKNDKQIEKDDKKIDDDKSTLTNDKTAEAKQYLEAIAKDAATSFETLPDGLRLPTWVLDKLRLAHDFLDTVSQHILDNSEFDDSDDDEEDNDENDEDEVDTAPEGQGVNANSKPNGYAAKGGMNESVKDDAPKNLRKIGQYENGIHKSVVYKDPDFDEFRVKHYKNGTYVGSYHTDDKADAHGTAKLHVNNAKD